MFNYSYICGVHIKIKKNAMTIEKLNQIAASILNSDLFWLPAILILLSSACVGFALIFKTLRHAETAQENHGKSPADNPVHLSWSRASIVYDSAEHAEKRLSV
jgi:hypothetical protein